MIRTRMIIHATATPALNKENERYGFLIFILLLCHKPRTELKEAELRGASSAEGGGQ